MFVDFLGNTIEVGDQVIYSPKGGTRGELVIAEVLALKPFVRYGNRENPETGRYESYELDEPGYKPHLQPLKSTTGWRDRQWVSGQGYTEAPARKVFLEDCSSMMLYKKEKDID